jgi:uncharacterized protein (UPF0332 family)
MYFTSFYVAQALLARHVNANPSHKQVEAQLHRYYGKSQSFPRTYVKLHSQLYTLRNDVDYRTAYSPPPASLHSAARRLNQFLKAAMRVVPRVGVLDIVQGLAEDNVSILRDLSYDIYCPRTYKHHTRLTCWQPPFYLSIFGPERLAAGARELLKRLRVSRAQDYVVGLNSRVDQYNDTHLVMLDFDAIDPAVESELARIKGILVKSGRGFHFIGTALVQGRLQWEQTLKRLRRHKVLCRHVDRDHIDLSLARGYSTLRVTASPVKPDVPIFFKEF